MLNLFKNFGKGILYVLVLPFLLVGLAIYAVVAFFVFIFLAIKGLVLFFTGRSLYEDLPEDKEAKRRIAIANGETPEDEMVQEEKHDEVTIQHDETENDPFYVPEYMKTEEQKAQVEQERMEREVAPEEPEVNLFETPSEPINEEPVKEEVPVQEEEIIIRKSSQNATILEINDDDDTDDNGVNIDFE